MGPGLGVNTLPNILWKASGVTTRPTSGLRLTVKNVNVPHPGPQGMQAARGALSQRTSARSTRSNPAGHPLQYLRATAQSHVRRSGLGDARLLSRPQQSASSTASTAAPQSTPKAVRTMLPPLASSPPVAEPPQGEGGSEQCSTDDEEDSSPLEDSDSEEEVRNIALGSVIW